MEDITQYHIDASQYILPTQNDINNAKKFVRQRESAAGILQDKVDEALFYAAEQIATICYKYNVNPLTLRLDNIQNREMEKEIDAVIDDMEMEILDLINEYSSQATEEKQKRMALLLWIATLGRQNRNFKSTLQGYINKFKKDLEAAIAALRYAGATLSAAVARIKTHLHSIYTIPEVQAAFKSAQLFAATYIKSRGVQYGVRGISNNGSTNITNMAKTTLQMAWMRQQGLDFEDNGVAGYLQLRGSSYPCDICDDEVGFHEGLDEIYTKPYPHPHCCCYRVPIYFIVSEREENVAERRNEIRRLARPLTEETFTHDDFGKPIKISNRGIKEWLNQPHRHYAEKNEILLDVKNVIKNSKYRG